MKTRKLSVSKFKEAVDRYRRIFPETCEGKTDVEILLYREIITPREAELMTPKPKAKVMRKKKIGAKVIRPYTENQVRKMAMGAVKDFKADMPNLNLDDAAYDMAESLLFADKRMQKFFAQRGVKREYMRESLADYFIE